MPHGAGPGGFGGGPGIGHGGFGGPGIGHGFGPGGHFGLHSGGPLGFVGRGGYSPGHYDQQKGPQTKKRQQKPQSPAETPKFINTPHHGQDEAPKFQNSDYYRAQSKQPSKHPKEPSQRKLHYGATTGNSPLLTRKSTRYTVIAIAIISAALACIMCMSNILATKVWAIGPFTLGGWTICGSIILDGGFILFPLTYIITDILVEICYRRIANLIVIFCCFMNLLSFCALQLTVKLPPAPDVMTVEPSQALGLSAQIMIASAIATLISTFVNNAIYDYMRRYESSHAVSEKAIRRRAWVSSFFAHIPDSAIFTFIAFSGYATLPKLTHQMITSYLAGIVVETILLLLGASKITYALRKYLSSIQD